MILKQLTLNSGRGEVKRSRKIISSGHRVRLLKLVLFLMLLGQQKGLVVIGLVELLVFQLDVLEQRAIRAVTPPATVNGTDVAPFDFVGCPSMSFLAVLVVLS